MFNLKNKFFTCYFFYFTDTTGLPDVAAADLPAEFTASTLNLNLRFFLSVENDASTSSADLRFGPKKEIAHLSG